MLLPNHNRRNARSGAALVTSLITVTTLSAAAVAMLMASMAVTNRTNATVARSRALQLAEAGLNEALADVGTAVPSGSVPSATIGSPAAPRVKGTGSYWADLVDLGDGTFRATSTGRAGLARRRLTAILSPRRSVFSYAIFAGNSSADPAYQIELGGSGSQGDVVTGDLYSGGGASLSGTATVTGEIDATETIVGATGNTGIYRSPPDVAGMNYAATADFNVSALFAGAVPGTFSASGTALQVPEDNPAHIFRLNPDDRAADTSATAKDDYFLEDPYESIGSFALRSSGDTGHEISLSGIVGKPGASGTDAVYYIDGNLWLHNMEFLGARFRSDTIDRVRITFVVRGNLYFSDDFELSDMANDGVAFVAQKDPGVPDSGNIYFGDPSFGTINHMEAFMYAENDFFDNNLRGSASSEVTITGTMAAGNQVNIDSDWVDASGAPQHSKLNVVGDDRLTTGALALPGIPGFGEGTLGYEVVFWQELAQ